MCGLSGFLSLPLPRDRGRDVLERMGNKLAQRGPDGQGFWLAEDGKVGLVHRRLEVIEPGPKGHQPMLSHSGRYVLIFNGEIYNHKELRTALEAEGMNFRGQSDTEVLIVALEYWGHERALKKLVGMFAFALWDRRKNRLLLSRDRFGEKPLYYGWQNRTFLFGSTTSALRQHPDWIGDVDREAVSLLLMHNYIPAPHSIFRGIRKLLPGTWLEIDWHDGGFREKSGAYWSVMDAAEVASANIYSGTFRDATDSLDILLRKTLKDQMLADVPLGAFLSGGIDSSAAVALMQSESTEPVRTFTIGFDDPAYDESSAAEAVARHLGTAHTTCRFKESDVLDLIPRLPDIYDEPFADASQLPMILVSQIARRDVTVALSGDGGDEIFGGYNRYVWGEKLARSVRHIPQGARNMLSNAISRVSPSGWDSVLGLLPSLRRIRHGGDKLHKLTNLLTADTPQEIYSRMVTFWPSGLPVGYDEDFKDKLDDKVWSSEYDFTERMMLADTLTYLPDDILVKVDRASMGVSLETRAPFLDHRVFEFAWSLPLSYRMRGKQSKAILREVLFRYVPKVLIERPKSGFSLPIGDYLRGPLRDWAESMLSRERLSREGYFDAEKVRSVWNQHLSQRFNREHELWSILMFQSWIENQYR